MAKQYTREQVLERVRKSVEAGKPVVIAGAGTGISGKFAERGGADLIGVYNSVCTAWTATARWPG
jgi:predicted TIM-barrel enzyme